MKKEISFNVNQSFWTTRYRRVTYSMLLYFTYLLYCLPPTEKKLKFQDPPSRRRTSLRICRKMNKEIRFNINQYLRRALHRTMTYSMLVYVIYVLYYLPRREKNPKILRPCFRKKNTIEQFHTK